MDRARAGQLGVAVSDLSMALRLLVGGMKTSTYDEGGEQYDIHLRAAEPFRNRTDVLSRLSVPSSLAGPVPLDNVVRLEPGDGPAEIHRLNRRRQVMITANNAPGFGETQILAGIEAAVRKASLPPDYQFGSAGRTKEMRKAGIAFLTAFLMAFVFMYLILAAQFES